MGARHPSLNRQEREIVGIESSLFETKVESDVQPLGLECSEKVALR